MPASDRIDRCVLPVRRNDRDPGSEPASVLGETVLSTTDRVRSSSFSMSSTSCGDTFISSGTCASCGRFFIVFSSSSSDRFFSMSSSAASTASASAPRTCTS